MPSLFYREGLGLSTKMAIPDPELKPRSWEDVYRAHRGAAFPSASLYLDGSEDHVWDAVFRH